MPSHEQDSSINNPSLSSGSDLEHATSHEPPTTLEEARTRIDAVDTELIRLLKTRVDLVEVVGVIKKEEGLPLRSMVREAEILERVQTESGSTAVVGIYRAILGEGRRLQGEKPEKPSRGMPRRSGYWG